MFYSLNTQANIMCEYLNNTTWVSQGKWLLLGATLIPRPALGAALVPSQDLALCQTLCTPHPTFPAGLHGRRGLKLKEQMASASTWLRGIGV